MSSEEILAMVDVIVRYSGGMFGWREPWLIQKPTVILRNLSHYKKKCYQYPSQSLAYDYHQRKIAVKYAAHNRDNILEDCVLVSTRDSGYWVGNVDNGCWYSLGVESPQLPNLTAALQRGSMAVDLFPRSSRLYFAGGYVMGMPISTVAELDLDSMKLGPVTETPLPRAYCNMVFFPDSLVLIGGTNCWEDVFSVVEQYDFLQRQWYAWPKLHHARYAASAVTIDERYVFVCGGSNRFYSVYETEWYDRVSKTWTDCGTLLTAANRAHCLRYREHIYLAGGHSRLMQYYDIAKHQWLFTGKLNYEYASPKLMTFDDRLIIADRSNLMSIEIFDGRMGRNGGIGGSSGWIATSARRHPIAALYPGTVPIPNHPQSTMDFFHLGRRYW